MELERNQNEEGAEEERGEEVELVATVGEAMGAVKDESKRRRVTRGGKREGRK